MITIEHLEVLLEDAHEQDEAALLRLIDRQLARHEAARASARADDEQAAADRAFGGA